VIQASSGIMAMTGTKDVHPIKFGAPAIDYATGMSGAFALASALFQRERTGRGQRIDMAMLDVAMILMSSHLTGCATAFTLRPTATVTPMQPTAPSRPRMGWSC
jgi:crotonobetainyl-CoA:carnitine CoA-transferase CaiB-like acyl-CoA transferase